MATTPSQRLIFGRLLAMAGSDQPLTGSQLWQVFSSLDTFNDLGTGDAEFVMTYNFTGMSVTSASGFTVYFGDGTVIQYPSGYQTVTHAYEQPYLTLKIFGNDITSILINGDDFAPDAIIAVHALPSTLTTLDLSFNAGLTTIASGFTGLSSLTTLTISSTGITAIPDLSPLTSLTTFTAQNNSSLTTLPSSLSSRTTLTSLVASGNALTTVPSLTNLSHLASIVLSGQALTVTTVNAVLVAANSWGTSGGAVDTSGQTPAAAPSGAGITAATALGVRSWTVTTD